MSLVGSLFLQDNFLDRTNLSLSCARRHLSRCALFERAIALVPTTSGLVGLTNITYDVVKALFSLSKIEFENWQKTNGGQAWQTP